MTELFTEGGAVHDIFSFLHEEELLFTDVKMTQRSYK